MTTEVTRRFQFAYGHRIVNHESKCRHLHGHNAVVHVTAVADQLDELGRVVDFSVLKTRIGKWIDDNWDHGMILWNKDEAGIGSVLAFNRQEQERVGDPHWVTKVYLLPENPTAENLAAHLMDRCKELMAGTGARVVSIRFEETENCSATVG